MPKISAVITAGGSGVRFNSQHPKQYHILNGYEIIFYSIRNFLQIKNLEELIITIRPQDESIIATILAKYFALDLLRIKICHGGATRSHSVLKGIKAAKSCDYILIHDAVRPFFTARLVYELLNKIAVYDGVAPVLKIQEAVKKIENNFVEHVSREFLYIAQTPQIFCYSKLLEYLKQEEEMTISFDDEITLVQKYSNKISYIAGDKANIKITDEEDMQYARFLADKYL